MPRNATQQTAEPQPEITAPEDVIAAVRAMPEDQAANVATHPTAKLGFRRFGNRDAVIPKVAAEKVQLLSEARESLAEAAKLADKGGESEAKAAEIGGRGGLLLYTGLASGVVSRSEVSAILGETFGWNGKGNKKGERVTTAEPDATRSATPYGMGNQLRQRIVRAHNAYLFVHGREADAGAFFDGLTPKDVQPILNEHAKEGGSLWTLYTKLADVKSQTTGVRPKDAFNPKKILSIVDTLGANPAYTVEMFNSNPSLFNAYDSLISLLAEIDRDMGETGETE